MSGDGRLSERKVKPVPVSLVVGGSIALFYSAAPEWVSAVRHARGHNFGIGFLAPPSLRRLRLCHPRSLRAGVGGGACGHALCFSPPFSLSLSRLIFLSRSDSSGQVGPSSLYFGWCEKWAAVPYHLPGRPWSDLTRVPDKPLTGRPPTKIGARRASSDEARNAAAPDCVEAPTCLCMQRPRPTGRYLGPGLRITISKSTVSMTWRAKDRLKGAEVRSWVWGEPTGGHRRLGPPGWRT